VSEQDGSTVREYHEYTKHSPTSVRANRHFLDWEIQPLPFKLYEKLEPIPLPRPPASGSRSALESIASAPLSSNTDMVPDADTIARLLHFSAGITRKRVYPGGHEMYFRAAACTGALYHIDVYLVCGDLPGLGSGVYHFGPHDSSLRRLRDGDYRAVLAKATAGEAAVGSAPALLVCTSTFWRNSWKYQARAYRHAFWDGGTVLANLLGVASGVVPARVVMGFVDREVNELLGLDTDREVALALVAVGRQPCPPPPSPPVAPLSLDTAPLSPREVDYPAIRAAHAASSLESAADVRSWRGAPRSRELPAPRGRTFALRALAAPPTGESVEQVILRRGSSRRFARSPIAFEQLSTMLRSASGAVPTDFLESDPPGPPESLVDLYLIVNAVDDLPAGAYVYHRDRRELELLREGDFRRQAGFLDLGQELAADASVDFYFLADLSPVLQRFGDRGYRAAQMEAAIRGGKLYLGAYALRLGATGLTFFDDEVTRFFSPHAAGKSVLFLAVAGNPAR
jgi:SagB-type dehydrogenase family enzyme